HPHHPPPTTPAHHHHYQHHQHHHHPEAPGDQGSEEGLHLLLPLHADGSDFLETDTAACMRTLQESPKHGPQPGPVDPAAHGPPTLDMSRDGDGNGTAAAVGLAGVSGRVGVVVDGEEGTPSECSRDLSIGEERYG
ncbi:unnamed protein product, partial [Discosporangium mesarthrocarpum]